MNKYVKRCRRLRAEVAELKTEITRLHKIERVLSQCIPVMESLEETGFRIPILREAKKAMALPFKPAEPEKPHTAGRFEEIKPRIVSNLPPDLMARAEALLKQADETTENPPQ